MSRGFHLNFEETLGALKCEAALALFLEMVRHLQSGEDFFLNAVTAASKQAGVWYAGKEGLIEATRRGPQHLKQPN